MLRLKSLFPQKFFFSEEDNNNSDSCCIANVITKNSQSFLHGTAMA
jgi:hypothetical protein